MTGPGTPRRGGRPAGSASAGALTARGSRGEPDGRWCTTLRAVPEEPALTLICCPYSGGSAEAFRPWAELLTEDIELMAVALPGRGRRIREAPCSDWGRLVREVGEALATRLARPHALYGHSFGGRLAYELAQLAADAWPGRTRHLFVSGCRCPDRPQARPYLHDLPEPAFRSALRRLGGTPAEVLADEELMGLLGPALRADMRLAEIWGDHHRRPLDAPVTALHGRDDPVDDAGSMSGWRRYTRGRFELVELPGGHFFPDTSRAALVRIICRRLAAGTPAGEPAPDGPAAGEPAPDGPAAGGEALALHRRLNDTAVPFPAARSVGDLVADVARRHPDAPAVVQDGRTLTYGRLDRLANGLAHRLAAAGAGPGGTVGVCVDRSPELIVALLAVLRAGAAYLPFDRSWPDAHLWGSFADAGCRWIVTDRSAALADRFPDLAVLEPAAPERARPPGVEVSGEAIAYVNFTSGSTGRPKGVPIRHRSITRLVSGARYAPLGEGVRVLHLAPPSFDAATFEIWGPLLNGGVCVLHPPGLVRLSRLARVVAGSGVDVVFLTTALFNAVVDEAPDALAGVTTILTGGEAHSRRHLAEAVRRYGPGTVVHVYGPTECTTFATYHALRDVPDDGRAVPIGRPIQNTRAYVMDGSRLCGADEDGEICLAGPGLSPGYLGRPELSRERFVEVRVGGRTETVYRTGDRGRLRADGEIVFRGRFDDQVKVNGHRIEPGEITYHLDRHPAVKQSHVLVAERPTGEKALAAFVVPEGTVHPDDIRTHLRDRLPGHLVPATVRFCEQLPLTATGKVDRRALLDLLESKDTPTP